MEQIGTLISKRVEFDGEMINTWDLLNKGTKGVEKFEEMHRKFYDKMAESLKAGKVVIAEMKLPLGNYKDWLHYAKDFSSWIFKSKYYFSFKTILVIKFFSAS